MRRSPPILRCTRASTVLLSAFFFVIFLIIYIWWPLAEQALAPATPFTTSPTISSAEPLPKYCVRSYPLRLPGLCEWKKADPVALAPS